jgi:hypothetical protein
MSRGRPLKSVSFTVTREGGWSAVTPLGMLTAEQGAHVTIVVTESWEQSLEVLRRKDEDDE